MDHQMSNMPSAAEAFILREMRSSDIAKAHALSSQLNWPHRFEDWEQLYRLSWGTVIETQAGEIIGTALTALQGAFATIGLVIVDPAYQGRRLGSQLMERGIAFAGDRTVVLNATEAGLPLYSKLGFEKTGTVLQFQGQCTAIGHKAEIKQVRNALQSDLETLIQLASEAAGYDRRVIITAFFATARECIVYMDGTRITGFGISRKFGRGYQVGPIVAGSHTQARAIADALLTDLNGEFARVDCLLGTELDDMLSEFGLAPVDRVQTMIMGTKPIVGQVRQFSIANQALG
jgi:GNAT superfamily N-acetyltransferase